MDTTLTADERADLLADAMTLEQKLVLFEPGGANARAIPELGIPGRRETGGSTGVNSAVFTGTTAFPAGVSLASTWDPELARQFGRQVGQEAWWSGFGGWAGPSADLTSNPYDGMQWTSLGEDPLLGGQMAAAIVGGVQEQDGVWSVAKHFVAGGQETGARRLDAVLAERPLRELYLREWEQVVQKGDPGAIMCARNKINGSPGCDSTTLIQDFLKGELAYPGWVASDVDACQSISAYNNGTDICGPTSLGPEDIRAALDAGELSHARFADMVHRILRTYFERGVIDNPPPGSLENPKPEVDRLPNDVSGASRSLAYNIALDGSVLLSNRNGTLPVTGNEDSFVFIGANAERAVTGFGSDIVPRPLQPQSVANGFRARLDENTPIYSVPGSDPTRPGDNLPGDQPVPSGVLRTPDGDAGLLAEYFDNTTFTGEPTDTRVEDQVNIAFGRTALMRAAGYEPSPAPDLPASQFEAAGSIRWTGTLNPVETGTYTLGLTHLGLSRLRLDRELIIDDDGAQITSKTLQVDLVAGRSYDIRIEHVADAARQCCVQGGGIGPAIRFTWVPPSALASPQIQEAVEAARTSEVAVVVASNYMGESLDSGSLHLPQNQDLLIQAVAAVNPNTTVVLATGSPVLTPWLNDVGAVVESWYAGQQQGLAIADLLIGNYDFTGRLPLTWPASEEQVTEGLGIDNPWADINAAEPRIVHDAGTSVGYREYLERSLDPLFEFGYGLSYGGVDYGDAVVGRNVDATSTDPIATTVNISVANVGPWNRGEIVQLYVGNLPTDVDTPDRALAGFVRVPLMADGENQEVEIPVDRRSLQYWDVDADTWVTPIGEVPVFIGSSLRDIRATGTITVAETDVDTTPPIVSTQSNPATPTGNNGWYRDPVELSITAHDDVDTAPRVEVRLNGGDFTAVTGPILIEADGRHTLLAQATDASGNVSEPAEWGGRMDRTAPTVVAHVQPGHKLVILADDATSGANKIEYRYALKVGKHTHFGPWLEYRKPLSIAATTLLRVEYRATDAAGNVSKVGAYR